MQYEFEDYVDSVILNRGFNYYCNDRILDIWQQDNFITAYIKGSEIYRIKLELKNNKIKKYSCSCPYSEEGMDICKHLTAVLYYINNNPLPQLVGKNNSKKKPSELDKIYEEMECNLRNISDRNGFINYYNGRYFVDLISSIADKIQDFIDDEEYENAFLLIKYTYYFIKKTSMDGSNGEYQEAFCILSSIASELLYNETYFEKYLDWAKDIEENGELKDFSDAPLYAFVLYAHDKETAKRVVEIIDDCDTLYGIFINKVIDVMELTYKYISKEKAINYGYANLESYNTRNLLIEYLKEENRINEVIKLLKDDLKNKIRKDTIYNQLITVYEENNMFDEKKKILPEVIIETNNFERYKELKQMCNKDEWQELKENIISKIKSNNSSILYNIYFEENEPDKLFALIKKNPNIDNIYKYQNILKDKYSKELLNYYENQILEMSKRVSDREGYQRICKYIKKMQELDNSSILIYDMIKKMYPIYRNKRAFKEEIINALASDNKGKFIELINNGLK